jgi:hypothetical protein
MAGRAPRSHRHRPSGGPEHGGGRPATQIRREGRVHQIERGLGSRRGRLAGGGSRARAGERAHDRQRDPAATPRAGTPRRRPKRRPSSGLCSRPGIQQPPAARQTRRRRASAFRPGRARTAPGRWWRRGGAHRARAGDPRKLPGGPDLPWPPDQAGDHGKAPRLAGRGGRRKRDRRPHGFGRLGDRPQHQQRQAGLGRNLGNRRLSVSSAAARVV